MANAVLDFVRRAVIDPFTTTDAHTAAETETGAVRQHDGATFGIPKPPEFVKNFPGSVAYFLDENEQAILYAMPWPYLGCPHDERTNSVRWHIGGQHFVPSRRDRQGNWFFRLDR